MIPVRNWKRALKKSIAQPGYAYRNFLHRCKSTYSYHRLDGLSYWPETISLFLTYKCNLRCQMCGQWGEKGAFCAYDKDTLTQRLSMDEIQALIDDVKFFNPNITLFGGEPMLYPGWPEVVQRIKAAGLRCNIVTNGTLIRQFASEIIESGLDEIIFSLDGPEEVHDSIRRVEGTFRRCIEGFRYLQELKKERNHDGPLININSTLFEFGPGHLEKVIAAAEEIGASGLTFHHLLFLDRETVQRFIGFFQDKFGQTPSDWLGFVSDELPKIDVEALIRKTKEIRRQKHGLDIAFYPNFTGREIRQWYTQYPFRSRSYKNRCMSLWMTAYIFPDGTIRPYHSMNFSPGSIRAQRFTEIWNNSEYSNYRNYIKTNKSFAVCAKGCTEFFRY